MSADATMDRIEATVRALVGAHDDAVWTVSTGGQDDRLGLSLAPAQWRVWTIAVHLADGAEMIEGSRFTAEIRRPIVDGKCAPPTWEEYVGALHAVVMVRVDRIARAANTRAS